MSVRKGRLLRALILVFALLATTVPVAGQSQTKGDVRLLFTGDILLSRQVEAELKTRIRPPWANFQKLFQSVEWVGANFEGVLGNASGCISSKSPCFATQESAAELLKRAGFRTVTIENNHAGDLGRAGREHTRQAFRRAGLTAVDFENSPQFVHFGKVNFAIVAVTRVPSADACVQHIPSIEVSEKLRSARSRANVVVVSIHWGNELMEWPSDTQRKEAAWLVRQGADLILGHHPHVIQRPECIEGWPVFFSLGNHVFDQENPKTKESLIADCRVRLGRLRCQGIRTHTDPGTTIPTLVGPDQGSDTALATCAPQIALDRLR